MTSEQPRSAEQPVPDQNSAGFVGRFQVLIDIVGFIVAAVVVHLAYLFYVTPAAEAVLAAADRINDAPPRVFVIIIKDFEQEFCLILSLWCLWLWTFRYRFFQDESYFLKGDPLGLAGLTSYGAEALDALLTRVRSLRQRLPASNLLGSVETAVDELKSSDDFRAAVQAAHEQCDLHLELLEAKLDMTKYILWAIPSVGFLGTVRGIGQALARADEAMAGDISGVAASLGVAFNSTYVALFLSVALMFVSYMLQGREERLVAGFKDYVADSLVGTLRRLKQQSGAAPDRAQDAAVY